ncbi:MAG: hypothetical protein R2806_25655 [Saprospiraceae bacterium]|nr:hypothetical protein [Lewinella sp.]
MEPKNDISLAELFPWESITGKTEDRLQFEYLDRRAAARIAAHLGLGLIEAIPSDQTNVCQANSEDVRPEYRTAVTVGEIFYYLLAAWENEPDNRDAVRLPSGTKVFWTLVERGRYKRDSSSRVSKC